MVKTFTTDGALQGTQTASRTCAVSASLDQACQLPAPVLPCSAGQHRLPAQLASNLALPALALAGPSTAAAEQQSILHQSDAQPGHQPYPATTLGQELSASAEEFRAFPEQQHAVHGHNPQSAIHLRQLPGSSGLRCSLPHTPFLDRQHQCPMSAMPLMGSSVAGINDLCPAASNDWVQRALAVTPPSFTFPGAIISGLSQDAASHLEPSGLASDPALCGVPSAICAGLQQETPPGLGHPSVSAAYLAWVDSPSAKLGGSSCDAIPHLQPSASAARTNGFSQDAYPALQLVGLGSNSHGDTAAEEQGLRLSGVIGSPDPGPISHEWNGLSLSAPIDAHLANQTGEIPSSRGPPLFQDAEQRPPGKYRRCSSPRNWGPCEEGGSRCEQLCSSPTSALPWWSVVGPPAWQDAQDNLAALDKHTDAGPDNYKGEQMPARQPLPGLTTSVWDGAHMPCGTCEVQDLSDAGSGAAPWYEQLPAIVSDSSAEDLDTVHMSRTGLQPVVGTAAGSPSCSLGHAQSLQQIVTDLDAVPSGELPLGEILTEMSTGALISRPVMCQTEGRLGCLLQSLAQPMPDGQQSPLSQRMPVLQEINVLRGAAARSPCLRALYHRNMQVIECIMHADAGPH